MLAAQDELPVLVLWIMVAPLVAAVAARIVHEFVVVALAVTVASVACVGFAAVVETVAVWIVHELALAEFANTDVERCGVVVAETDAAGVVHDAAVVAFDEAEAVVSGAEYGAASAVVGVVAVSEVSDVEEDL